MTRRALLIGSPTSSLAGVGTDVAMMGSALDRRGFVDIRRCEAADATRDGIVGAYVKLIADTVADDVALVYYAGHGQTMQPLHRGSDSIARANRQYIIPVDYDQTTVDDFRGITAVELSVLLAQLTEKTHNAIVVLDCCHSALMSRDRGHLRIRQLTHGIRHDLDAHLKRRLDAGLRIDLAHSTANPYAVRLVACGLDQYAYEVPNETGSDHFGLFTRSLVDAMDEADGARVSWSTLMGRVRQLVQTEVPHQRPEVEGPSDRVLFETASDDAPGSVKVIAEDGRVCLPGAPLLGVQVGDVFAIMPASASGPAVKGRIATVRIDCCDRSAASGTPAFDLPGTVLPLDARAFRTNAMAPHIAVRVPDALVPAVRASTFVRVAEPGEEAALEVTMDGDGAMTIHDRFGPLHDPRRPGRDLVTTVVADLNRCARATILRTIREESGWTIDAPVMVEWGLVRGGRPHPLPASGAPVNVGDAVYVKVGNNGGEDLRLSLVDIGVAYRVTVLTAHEPAGVVLPAGGEYVFGQDRWSGRLVGVSSTWPEGLHPGSARPETVLALFTTEAQDLSVALSQPGVRARSRERSLAGSPLARMLAHLGAGQTRDLGPVASRYAVRSVEFDLVP